MHENANELDCPDYKNAIVYGKWTPEWLRVRTDFLIRKIQTERIQFTIGHLPNKRWCTKKDSRYTCRAILVERLRKELDTRDVLLDELRKIGLSISEDAITGLDNDVHIMNVAEDIFTLDMHEELQPSPKTIDACVHPKHNATFSTDDNDFHSKPAVAEARSRSSKEHAPQRPGILYGTTSKFLNGKKKTAQINSEKCFEDF